MTGQVCSLQCNHSVVQVDRTHNHTLLSHLRLLQPGGPGSRIYILQEQGGPVIPLGIGFPLHLLLLLAVLWWRYSNPPPHGKSMSPFLILIIWRLDPAEASCHLPVITMQQTVSSGSIILALR
jgi:hypothetical protein